MSKESDTEALEDNGYDTNDVGRGSAAINEKSVAKETGSTSSQAAAAAHDFRDDSGARTGDDAEHFKSAPTEGPQHTEGAERVNDNETAGLIF